MKRSFLHYLLLAYTFFIPWQARWIIELYSTTTPVYGDLSVYLTDLLFAVIICIWLAQLVKQKPKLQDWKNLSLHKKLGFGGFVFVLLYISASVLWAPELTAALVAWNRFLQFLLFILILLTSKISRREVVGALLASGVVQALIGLGQFFLQEIPASTLLGVAEQQAGRLGASVIEYKDERWLRAYGMLPHPNIFGGLMFITAMVASAWYIDLYHQFYKWMNKWEKMGEKKMKSFRNQISLSLGSFCIAILGLLVSFSRSAWLSFAFAWVVFVVSMLYIYKKEWKLIVVAGIKLIVAGVMMLGILSLAFGPLWTHRVNDQSRLGAVSISERAYLLEQAKGIVESHTPFGTGIGGYLPAFMEQSPGMDIFKYQPVHTVWVLLYAELGWVGLSLFGLWGLAIIRSLRTVMRRDQGVDSRYLLAISLLVALGVGCSFDHYWWTLPAGLMMHAVVVFLVLSEQATS